MTIAPVAASVSSASKPEVKIESQSKSDFLQTALENFKGLSTSQVFSTPKAFDEGSVNFWKNKLETNRQTKSFEEGLEDAMFNETIAKIKFLLNLFK